MENLIIIKKKKFVLKLLTIHLLFLSYSYGQEIKISFDSIKKSAEPLLILRYNSTQTLDSIIIFKSGEIISTGFPVYTITTLAEKRTEDSTLETSKKQKYPNPWPAPTTSLTYHIEEESLFTIIVSDTLGNEIVKLLNEELPQGEYKVNFSIYGILKPDVYFVEIKFPGYLRSWKLIIRDNILK